MSAETLDISKLIPAATSEAGKPGVLVSPGAAGDTARLPAAQPQQAMAEEAGPFTLPVEMQGTIAINTAIYRQLALEQVHADLMVKNNHLQITRLHGGLAGGELTAVMDIDLGTLGLSYQGQLDLAQSQLATLVSGLFPGARQRGTGVMYSQNTFSGRGTRPDNLLKSLLVKGRIQVRNGQVSGSSLLKELAEFLGKPDLEVLSFETMQSRYDLGDRVVQLTGNLDSSSVRLQPAGTVSLDGLLNLDLNVRLAPGVIGKLGGNSVLQQALIDENSWGVLPLKLDGTISNPRYGLDTKALQRQAVEKAKQEIQKQLLQKIAPEGRDGAPANQLFDKALNKLFGK